MKVAIIERKFFGGTCINAGWEGALTPEAFNNAEIVSANLLDHDSRKVSDRITAYALYIDPPLGRAGLTEEEIRKSNRHALIGRRPTMKVDRAVEKGETQGFMKIIVDAQTHEILGAAILRTGGDEAIHSILDKMYGQSAIHDDSPRRAHSPYLFGTHPHNAWRTPATFQTELLPRSNTQMKNAGETVRVPRLRRLRRRELPIDTVELARYLIGKVVVHERDDGRCQRTYS